MGLKAFGLFFLLLYSGLVSGSRIIIDPKSCRNPFPKDPTVGIANVQAALDEAFSMAQTAKTTLAQALVDPTTETGKKVNYIMKTILAAEISGPFYARVQRM